MENQYGTTYHYADRRGSPEYSTIDSIRFTYDPSNLIESVFVLSDPNIGYRASSVSYGYDNGNVESQPGMASGVSDPSHRISNIECNILNLPQKIYSEKGTIDISYDGEGNVLRKKIVSKADTLPNVKL